MLLLSEQGNENISCLRGRKYKEAGENCMMRSYRYIICRILFTVYRIIKLMSMTWLGLVARMGKMRNAYKILFGKSEGTRPIRRRRHRWENNIKTNLKEIV
jgi:hypothetical protein